MPPGRKPKPPGEAVTRHKKVFEFVSAPGVGWQHGEVPEVPSGLTAAGERAWVTWFGAWWAAFWQPEDVPALEMTVRLYDGHLAGHVDAGKVVPMLDRYGITPKGRQDLRWQPPKVEPEIVVEDEVEAKREARRSRLA